jgi:N-acylglucosamine-6-phosphate 2-epimerase
VNPLSFATQKTLRQIDASLKHRLVVSCQPIHNSPMDRDTIVVQMALAALAGGAGGVRIESVTRVAALRAASDAIIIGLVKRDLSDSPVRITPSTNDVAALIAAGANIVAVDATQRARPESIEKLLSAIRSGGAVAMADCSNLADATAAHTLGFDIIGTTLSGYTNGRIPDEPDYRLLENICETIPRVMAEGRFNRPEQAQRAIKAGAWSVTVGTAITRTETVTEWFAKAVAEAQ